jgi:electron transfer flavoprotein alpha subunit
MKTLILVASQPGIGAILDQTRPGGEVRAVVAGPVWLAEAVAVQGLDAVDWLDPGPAAPAEALAGAVADLAATIAPDLVVAPNRGPERVLAGRVAVRLGAPLLTGVSRIEDGGAKVVRAACGALVEETVAVKSGPAVLVMNGGLAAPSQAEPAPVEAHPGRADGIVLTDRRPVAEEGPDLAGADVVVALGRGLADAAGLELAKILAAKLGGAVGCTRPLAEGDGLFDKGSYIGISGQTVAPKLYIALGVSGQLQHVVGMRGSGTVVAVNTDPKAPFFEEADFGIAGDAKTVAEALLGALA